MKKFMMFITFEPQEIEIEVEADSEEKAIEDAKFKLRGYGKKVASIHAVELEVK